MATKMFLLLLCTVFCSSVGHPHPTQARQAVISSSGSAVNPAVLGSLLTFSQRLSDMERKIKAHDKRILKHEETISGLKQSLNSKAPKSELEKLKRTLGNNVGKIREIMQLRTMEVDRYRNKLRTLEGAYSATETEYARTRGKVEELEDRFSMFSADCRRVKTGWKNRADGEIMFLDRHHVVCRSNEFLQSFVLNKRSDYDHALVRYEYRCCSLNL